MWVQQLGLMKTVKCYTYDETKKLGQGSTGVVYLGTDLITQQPIAIKAILLKNIDNEVTQYLLKNEVKALTMTNHPNVLKAIDMIQDENFVYVVTDYLPKGTLGDYITKRGVIPEREALEIFRQLVEGYDHILDLKMFHRDLKPHNILFDQNFKPILSDFGYCEVEGFLNKPNLKYNVGSPGYMAPESMVANVYSQNSEVWSLGSILYEMMAGRNYTNGKPVMEAIMMIKKQGPYYPDNSSDFVKMLLRECMTLKPEDRMKIKPLRKILNDHLSSTHPHLQPGTVPQLLQTPTSIAQTPLPLVQPHFQQRATSCAVSTKQMNLAKPPQMVQMTQPSLAATIPEIADGHKRKQIFSNKKSSQCLPDQVIAHQLQKTAALLNESVAQQAKSLIKGFPVPQVIDQNLINALYAKQSLDDITNQILLQNLINPNTQTTVKQQPPTMNPRFPSVQQTPLQQSLQLSSLILPNTLAQGQISGTPNLLTQLNSSSSTPFVGNPQQSLQNSFSHLNSNNNLIQHQNNNQNLLKICNNLQGFHHDPRQSVLDNMLKRSHNHIQTSPNPSTTNVQSLPYFVR